MRNGKIEKFQDGINMNEIKMEDLFHKISFFGGKAEIFRLTITRNFKYTLPDYMEDDFMVNGYE